MPLASNGADQALLCAVVADDVTGTVHSAGQRRFRDNSPLPDVRNEGILRNNSMPVLDEVEEKVKNTWLNCYRITAATQFAPVWIEGKILKKVDQFELPACGRRDAERQKIAKNEGIGRL